MRVGFKDLFKKIDEKIGLFDLAFITWLSVLLHFWRITYPNSVVFDEVTFGKFLNAYAKGEYYFDLHPPLGKLLLAWASYFGGLDPQFNYEKIGTVFTNSAYIWIRSLTAFAGALIPTSVALFMRGLGFSRRVAVFAALFVIFENALLVISRTFVFDIFLISFGFASLAAGVWFWRTQNKILWWMAWLLGAAAFSIKWTGLSFLGVLTLWELQKGWKDGSLSSSLSKLLVGWLAAGVFYFFVFVVHFSWTPNSGIGNDFMSAEFQSGLIGSRYYGRANMQRPSLWGQFIELNKMMWSYQKTMNQAHPYSSQWYTWPLLYRPIYFWGNTDLQLKERIYLLGNPWLWWCSTVAIAAFLFRTWRYWRAWLVQAIDGQQSREFCLVLLFVANYLPFVLIGRVMFIYHYLVALVAALMVLAVTIDRWSNRRWVWIFLATAIISFCYFAPLSYALPLSDAQYNWRLWFSSWL